MSRLRRDIAAIDRAHARFRKLLRHTPLMLPPPYPIGARVSLAQTGGGASGVNGSVTDVSPSGRHVIVAWDDGERSKESVLNLRPEGWK